MKRFEFRLRRLERLRHMQKRESGAALAVAADLLDERRKELSVAKELLLEGESGWRSVGMLEPASSNSLREAAAFMEATRGAAAAARHREQAALETTAAAKNDYVEKSRAHNVLERLRDRKWWRWLTESAREEQRLLDELYLLQPASARKVRENLR